MSCGCEGPAFCVGPGVPAFAQGPAAAFMPGVAASVTLATGARGKSAAGLRVCDSISMCAHTSRRAEQAQPKRVGDVHTLNSPTKEAGA